MFFRVLSYVRRNEVKLGCFSQITLGCVVRPVRHYKILNLYIKFPKLITFWEYSENTSHPSAFRNVSKPFIKNISMFNKYYTIGQCAWFLSLPIFRSAEFQNVVPTTFLPQLQLICMRVRKQT